MGTGCVNLIVQLPQSLRYSFTFKPTSSQNQ